MFVIIFSMVNGVHDGWGYIEPYIASYLRQFDSEIGVGKVQWLYFVILLSSVVSGFTLIPIKDRIGYKGGIWLSFMLLGAGFIVCGFSKKFEQMVVGFFFIGLGITIQFLMNGFLMMSL